MADTVEWKDIKFKEEELADFRETFNTVRWKWSKEGSEEIRPRGEERQKQSHERLPPPVQLAYRAALVFLSPLFVSLVCIISSFSLYALLRGIPRSTGLSLSRSCPLCAYMHYQQLHAEMAT